MIFDDTNEKGALKKMIMFLKEGMPENRVVNKVPDFLVRENILG